MLNCIIENGTEKAIHAVSDSPFGRGVSVLFNEECNIDILNVHKSKEGRKRLVNATIEDFTYNY